MLSVLGIDCLYHETDDSRLMHVGIPPLLLKNACMLAHRTLAVSGLAAWMDRGVTPNETWCNRAGQSELVADDGIWVATSGLLSAYCSVEIPCRVMVNRVW